ncbi:MAG: hypothetical protein ACTSSP_06205 [Candidatus Asgardarchaeia archaeon]
MIEDFKIFDTVDEVLGDPILHKIIAYLSVYGDTDIETLKSKLGINLEILVRIIAYLMDFGIVERTKDNKFAISKNNIGTAAKTLYTAIINSFLSIKMNELIDELKNVKSYSQLDFALKKLNRLLKFYGPIIEKKYKTEISAINLKINDLRKRLKG